MESLKKNIKEILKYPSAIIGAMMVFAIFFMAIYTIITLPLPVARNLWRGGEGVWYDTPRYAKPAWLDAFSTTKELETIKMGFNMAPEKLPEGVTVDVDEKLTSNGYQDISLTYTFDYQADVFPSEVSLFFKTTYDVKNPFVEVLWYTPDGRKVRISSMGISHTESIRINQDENLKRKLGGFSPEIGLFMDPESDPDNPVPLKGEHTITIRGIAFEDNSSIDSAELIIYGTVFGIFGTDNYRRDLTVPIMWGAPIALAFGLTAAVGVSLLTVIISATGAWYGGIVDGIIQRITEVNMVLPFLSILIMVGTFYSKSLWVILGVTILLSIFGGGIKGYRAIFLQIRESTYIEAAQAYGASNSRIIFRYLIPRIIPLLIPGFVLGIPMYVFLEASLAVLGLGDPTIPTWGKVINNAYQDGAIYNGYYYWILEPAFFLMFTGLGFAMLGFSLDRIFNPRLRGL